MRTADAVIEQVLEMCRTYQPRKLVWEGNAQQKSTLFQESMQRGLKSLGIRHEIYQTMTGTGGRAKQSNFDITTIGGLFDGGLITLPYGGTHAEVAKVDAYIDQFCAWRTDSEGSLDPPPEAGHDHGDALRRIRGVRPREPRTRAEAAAADTGAAVGDERHGWVRVLAGG